MDTTLKIKLYIMSLNTILCVSIKIDQSDSCYHRKAEHVPGSNFPSCIFLLFRLFPTKELFLYPNLHPKIKHKYSQDLTMTNKIKRILTRI